jgi:hypothetical protein
MLNLLSYAILGVLYRDYNSALLQIDHNFKMQQADHSFVKLILEQDDSINELFETELQLRNFIKDEQVFVFHKNEEFVGCGMVQIPVMLTTPLTLLRQFSFLQKKAILFKQK